MLSKRKLSRQIFSPVDIALPGDMQLHQAHDIGTDLQIKLEALPEIERAFVHIDYEYAHKRKNMQANGNVD